MVGVNPIVNIKAPMGLFDKKGVVKVEKLLNFMDILRSESASVFGLTGDQLRPERMTGRTKEVMGELAGRAGGKQLFSQ